MDVKGLHPAEEPWEGEDGAKDVDMGAEVAPAAAAAAAPEQTYLPGTGMGEDEALVFDPTAYIAHTEFMCDWPCLSFDVLPDRHGNGRSEPPFSASLVAGTQASDARSNKIVVMNLTSISRVGGGDDGEEEEDGDDAVFESHSMSHAGGINRIRVAPTSDPGVRIVATWAETGRVHISDIRPLVEGRVPPKGMSRDRPIFTFSGHSTEGYAMDWSPASAFRLATGDNNGAIHVWDKQAGGVAWTVNDALRGHKSSVEDIQWSPAEPNVFASCSADKTVKIWDCRAPVLSVNAHNVDVNVISWNRLEQYLLLSGDDVGQFKIWDLRNFSGGSPQPIATFAWHKDAITSLEWHPTDPSVLAVAGADDQVTLWDMAVELDTDAAASSGVAADEPDVPPQLLFIHQGQTELKEVHWHPQIPGAVLSTAEDGFNFFKTISV